MTRESQGQNEYAYRCGEAQYDSERLLRATIHALENHARRQRISLDESARRMISEGVL